MSKTYTESDIRKIFKQHKYNYASLKNSDGKSVVTYNTENNPKVTAAHKVDEAFSRMQTLPDGVYYFCFANSKGRNVQPDEFCFLKGNIMMDENKQTPYQIIHQPPAQKNEYERILSYPEVMNLNLELTTLKFKLSATEAELVKANANIAELEAEIKELEQKGLSDGDPNSPAKWFEQLSGALLPIADRYLTVRERELDRPRPQPQLRKQPQRQPHNQPPKQPVYKVPEIGSEEWERFLDQMEAANDQDYEYTLSILEKQHPTHHAAVIEALEGEDTDENQL